MFEIAAGVLLAFAIRHVVRVAATLLWDEYAYTEPGVLRSRVLLGRWPISIKPPLPVRFLRRLFEEQLF